MAKRRGSAEETNPTPPHFFKIILSPHASKLHIPDEFVMEYGANLGDIVILEVPTRARWEVKLQHSNGMAWLKEGWNPFKEYYSIGCGYFLLFQYNGNSHFSVLIFDLRASEIAYRSGPNEDMTPENIVDTEGDTSHRKKVDGTETKNKACDEIVDGLLTNNTADNNGNACDRIMAELPIRKTAKDIKANACDDIVDGFPTSKTAKDNKVNALDVQKNMTANDSKVNACDVIADNFPTNKTEKDNKVNACDEIVDSLPANKTAKDNKVNACVEIVGDLMNNKTSKDDKVADDSYSRRQKSGVPLSFPICLPERQDPSRVKLDLDVEEDLYWAAQKGKKLEIGKEKLEKQNSENNLYCAVDKGKEHCYEVPDLFATKMTEPNQQLNKRKYSLSLEASYCRYPLRNKQAKVVKLEEQHVQQNLYCEACKYQEHCNELPAVDLSVSKAMITSQHNEKKTTSNLDVSCCRYPLRSNQLKGLELEQWDAASKMTVANQLNEKKTSTSLDISPCRYPLRSKQLKEVKLEQQETAAKTMITNQHNEKNITTHLDASRCRYPLRSKHLKEVKLEQQEAQGNMHFLQSKETVEAYLSYCKRQESCLPACSPSSRPERKEANKVKLEKPDMEEVLFCTAQKEKAKETNNVKLEKGDVGGNLYNTTFKVKDPSASRYDEGKNFTSLETSRCRYLLRSKLEQPAAQGKMHYAKPKIEKGCDGVSLAEKQHSTETCEVKSVDFGEAHCSRSRNPQFVVSMQPTYVSKNFQLNIPANFIKRSFKEEESVVTLRVSDGRTWDAKCYFYSNCAKIGSAGWREFVRDNGLKVHDTCLFEMMEGIKPVLHVSIFRFLKKGSTPILHVDSLVE